MACRTPVVSTRVSGPDTYVEHQRNGFLADFDDVDALTRHAAHVLDLPDPDWRRLSDAAWTAAQRFDWDHATDRFLDGLHRAIARAATPSP